MVCCVRCAAFDKADLLYLRDTAEQQRHKELEQRDSESAQFAALRARLEQEAMHDGGPPAASTTTGVGPSKSSQVTVSTRYRPLCICPATTLVNAPTARSFAGCVCIWVLQWLCAILAGL